MRYPHRHNPLHELEWRWRIPKKSDDKEWNHLRKKVAREELEWSPRRRVQRDQELARIDRIIESTEKQRPFETKDQKLRSLEFRRRQIETKFTEPGGALNEGHRAPRNDS